MQILNLVVLFDIAPRVAPPNHSVIGVVGAVAFGLFLTTIALAVFLLLRKKVSTTIRVGLSISLIVLAIVGSIAILAGALVYDWKIEKDRDDSQSRRNDERSKRILEESGKNKINSNNSNTNTNNVNSNSK